MLYYRQLASGSNRSNLRKGGGGERERKKGRERGGGRETSGRKEERKEELSLSFSLSLPLH